MRADRLTASPVQSLPNSTVPSASHRSASAPDPVACFSIQALAEPTVMPRVLELFAKRGLIPSRWHSDLGGRRQDELTIDFQVSGLTRDKADLIAHAIRQFVSVSSVLTSEKLYA
jgi:acetolactate synthase small subunit